VHDFSIGGPIISVDLPASPQGSDHLIISIYSRWLAYGLWGSRNRGFLRIFRRGPCHNHPPIGLLLPFLRTYWRSV